MEKLFQQADKALNVQQRQLERKIAGYYAQSLKEIRSKLAEYDSKYGLDFAELQKYNRLTALENEISNEIGKLTGKSTNTLKAGLNQAYQESYYRTAFAFEKTIGIDLGFTLIPKKAIEKAVLNPLDRIGFLQRNKDNQAKLARQLKEELTRGLIQGKGYRDTAKAIKERLDVGASNVLRIVQTESHRVKEQGRFDGIQEAGKQGIITKKQWVSTLDDRTRDTHQDLDGVQVEVGEEFEIRGNTAMFPGEFGVPEEDINCRCTHIAVIEGYEPRVRRARDEGIIEYKNYNEWKKDRIK
jgi:SPP1 gp7 family putative phage head morphogenesis protein